MCMDFPRNQKIHFESSDMWQNLATTGSSDSFSLFIDKSRYGWKYISDTRYYILVNGTGISSSIVLIIDASIVYCANRFAFSAINLLAISKFPCFLWLTHNYKYVAASTDSGELLYAKIS